MKILVVTFKGMVEEVLIDGEKAEFKTIDLEDIKKPNFYQQTVNNG